MINMVVGSTGTLVIEVKGALMTEVRRYLRD